MFSEATRIDAQETLNLALRAYGLDQIKIRHRLRILSNDWPSYVSDQFAEWLAEESFTHTRGAPYHPQTQGKIERWHQTLNNLTLADVYFGRGNEFLQQRAQTKRRTMKLRRLHHARSTV